MFVQVIRASTSEPEKVRAAMLRWVSDLAPGATGWLGSTGGVAEDGTVVLAARFDSPDSARVNSDRPEQEEWWAELAEHLEGEVRFVDCAEAETFPTDPTDEAGFVQVIEATVSDRERLRELIRGSRETLLAQRPDIVGGLVAWHDGGFTQIVYFTSEAEARRGESAEVPDDPAMAEANTLMGEASYVDLRDPWLLSPA